MLQYQHVSVATFEGYVGTSQSGFRREVEAERRLAALDDIVEDDKDHRAGIRVTGAGAVRRNALFDDVAAQAGEGPGVVVDDVRLRAVLQNVARTLYPGILNDWFYNETTAACRGHSAPGPGPLLPACQPGRCVRELRASVDTLAQQVQVLTLENHALRTSLAAQDTTIVPLPGTRL